MKRILASFLALCLLASMAPNAQSAQVSAGKACKKINSSKKVGLVTFSCKKVKGKLIWTSKPPSTQKNQEQNNQNNQDQNNQNKNPENPNKYVIGWICDGVADARGAKDANGVEIVCVQGGDGKFAWVERKEYDSSKNPPPLPNNNENKVPANGLPCAKVGEEFTTPAGIELTCIAGSDLQTFWVAGDQSPKAALFGNENIRASMRAFPRPLLNKCQPEPGQEYQYYRTGKTFAIDPFDTKHFIVAVERLGIFESFDAGTTWLPASTEGMLFDMKKSDATVCFKESPPIKFDPSVKGRIYLLFGGTGSVQAKKWQARGSGLYVSNDNGKSWEFLTKPEMNSYTSSLAIDPKNSNILYLGSGSSPLSSTESNPNETFVNDGIVYKSIDAGKTWEELKTGWGKHTRAYSLRVDPNNSNTILMSVFQTPLGQDPNNKSATGTNLKPGLHVSYDAGKTWAQLGNTPNHQLSIYNISVSDNGEGIIFTPQQSSVATSFYSIDGGKTINAIPGKEILLPTFVPGSNQIAYGIREGSPSIPGDQLLRTTDGGQSWSVYANTPAEMQFTLPESAKREHARPQQISFEPNNPSTMFINGAGGKIARSTDGGLTWKLLTTWETFPKMDVIAK
jgi:photosystem II stability/assembly factor-like uncharacterized protein